MTEVMISVIDDDAATRSALAGFMRAKGFGVNVYDSAESFLKSEAYKRTDCIVTDVQMPGMSGIELKRCLKARRCNTPVILITARAEPRLHAQAAEIGAFALVGKPFRAAALVASIEQAIRDAVRAGKHVT